MAPSPSSVAKVSAAPDRGKGSVSVASSTPVPSMSQRYWSDLTLSITVDGPQGERTVVVEKPYARLACHPAADVHLPDANPDDHGLYLHACGDGIFFMTFLRGKDRRPVRRGWLPPLAKLLFGPYKISAQRVGSPPSGPEVPAAALDGRDSASLPSPVLGISFTGAEVARRRLIRALTLVGQLAPSHLRIRSDDLSMNHLVLYWEGETLWAVDLLSRVGMQCDGKPVECVALGQGRSLAIGEVALTYVERSASSPLDETAPHSEEPASRADDSRTVASTAAATPADARNAGGPNPAAVAPTADAPTADTPPADAPIASSPHPLELVREEILAEKKALAELRSAMEAAQQDFQQRMAADTAAFERLREECDRRQREIEDRRRQRDAEWTQREARLAESERDLAERTAQLATLQQALAEQQAQAQQQAQAKQKALAEQQALAKQKALAEQQAQADQQAKRQSQYEAQRAADARRIRQLTDENEQLQRQIEALRAPRAAPQEPSAEASSNASPDGGALPAAVAATASPEAVVASRRGDVAAEASRSRPAPSDVPLYKGVLQCRFDGDPPPLDEPSPWADRLADAWTRVWTHARNSMTRLFAGRGNAKPAKRDAKPVPREAPPTLTTRTPRRRKPPK